MQEGPFTLCGAPGGAPGAAWSRTWPRYVAALATDSHENIAVMVSTPEGSAPTLLDPRGELLWARSGMSWVFDFRGLSVTPSGEWLTWGYRDGDTGPGWSVSYGYDAQGNSPEQIYWCGDECSMGPHYKDAEGNLLYRMSSSASSRVGYVRAGGGGWSLSHSYWDEPPMQDPLDYGSAVLDDEGAVRVAASLQGQGTFQGRSLGTAGQSSGVVLKLSTEGQLLWAREFTGATYHFSLVASGSAVVGTFRGALTWEGGELRAPRPELFVPFLAVLDSRGQVTWAQVLPFPAVRVARSPSGNIAVASEIFEPRTERQRSVHLREYDPRGRLNWSRTWFPREASGAVWIKGLVWSEGSWVLGGSSRGSVSFGETASWTSEEQQGFVVKLQPAP